MAISRAADTLSVQASNNLLGQQTSSTDATGGTTALSYDAAGNLTQSQDPAGNSNGASSSSVHVGSPFGPLSGHLRGVRLGESDAPPPHAFPDVRVHVADVRQAGAHGAVTVNRPALAAVNVAAPSLVMGPVA